jgi:glycosyltransferase involved in cell wall biosynthesis
MQTLTPSIPAVAAPAEIVGREFARSRPPRVLLIAEACNPRLVSVPLEGWSHYRAIAALTNAHLVTQVRNRAALLDAGLGEGRDFTAIDSEAVARPIHRLATFLRGGSGTGWTTGMALAALSYPYFEHLIWRQFGPRIAGGEFDVVHRLTPLSPTLPSLLAGRCRGAGVPFVIGPLNGGVPWPAGFDSARRREREWLSYIRNAYKLLPGYQATRRHSAAMLVGSRDTLAQMPATWRSKCFYIAENAIDPERFVVTRTRTASSPLRAIFVGRLVPYKGADMLVEAAADLLRRNQLKLDIIGDGPLMNDLCRLIQTLGVGPNVKLSGFVPHEQLAGRLAESDVFAFPSIREFGGAAVLEAMAVGVVPIVVDYGGPGELVSEGSGFRIPIGPRKQIVRQLGAILAELAADPRRVDERSVAAMRRARRQFTWAAKAAQVVRVYRWVCDPGAPRPDFAMPAPDLSGELSLTGGDA